MELAPAAKICGLVASVAAGAGDWIQRREVEDSPGQRGVQPVVACPSGVDLTGVALIGVASIDERIGPTHCPMGN